MLSLRAGPPRLVLRAAVGRQMPFPSAQIARRPGASAWSHLARVAWRLQKHDSACETTVCDENDRRRRRESTHRVVNKACGFERAPAAAGNDSEGFNALACSWRRSRPVWWREAKLWPHQAGALYRLIQRDTKPRRERAQHLTRSRQGRTGSDQVPQEPSLNLSPGCRDADPDRTPIHTPTRVYRMVVVVGYNRGVITRLSANSSHDNLAWLHARLWHGLLSGV